MTAVARNTTISGLSPKRSIWRRTRSFVRRDPIGAVSYSIIIVLMFAAVLGSRLAPYDPLATDPQSVLLPPLTDGHVFGTDQIGRDVFSRVLAGTRVSLIVVLLPTLAAGLIGSVVGLWSGYAGGIFDTVVMRAVDVLLAVPALIMALAISAALGPSPWTLIIALTVPSVPIFVRIVRQQAQLTRHYQYVEAAYSIGANNTRIVIWHIFPSVAPLLIVVATGRLALLLLTASSLSYLGAGTPAPDPDWGNIVAGGARYLFVSPWSATLGGAVIFFATLAFNLAGDSIRDELDPFLRNRR